MIIEIRGVGMSNKGAELMLCAIIQHLRRKLDQIKFVVEPLIGSYAERARYGLYQKMNIRKAGRTGFIIEKLMHKGYRQNFGIITESEIDVVLDASGFAYGDQWGPDNTIIMAENVKRWKKEEKKIILLPQAFGSFEGYEIRRAFLQILEHSDLVYARDKKSYQYIKNLGSHFDNVSVAPDFTNLIEGHIPKNLEQINGRACIIPNNKMIEQVPIEHKDKYMPFLVESIKYLVDKGKRPFVLVHESQYDYKLISNFQDACEMPIEVIKESDPLILKGIIGSSFLVIGSRFHGIVNALSQNIPSIGTSWSHKYQYLFEDYCCPEYLLDISATISEIKKKIDLISVEPDRSQIIEKLKRAGDLERQKTIKMWEQVEELIAK